MTHDFDEKHGGKGNAKCDGKGIMSYGTPPAEWSKCSVEDFTGYYNSKNWGETCLKSNWYWIVFCLPFLKAYNPVWLIKQ